MPLITVSQLNNYMKRYIDQNIHLSDLWVKGEISNFKKHYSGHLYLTLKDENSNIKAVMFNSYAEKLKFMPQNGDKVIVFGKVSVYERDGAYQFYAESMIPDGVGELYAAYERLKSNLEKEGLFDIKYKRKIPAFPRCIGVITSVSGAALRDIMNVIKRRYTLCDVCIYPVKVQGVGASDTICEGLNFFSDHKSCDVVILARGGGSIEDLWAYNEEKTARAIFDCKKPVVSGVGHETDFTISDFVADLRAPTPSAAAELVTPSTTALIENIDYLKTRINNYIENSLNYYENALLDLSKETINLKIDTYLKDYLKSLDILKATLITSFTNLNTETLKKLSSLCAALNAMDPKKVLERGYSFVSDNDDNPLNPGDIKIGDKIKVIFDKGYAKCDVLEVDYEK